MAVLVTGLRAHDGTPAIVGSYPDGVEWDRGDLKDITTGEYVLQGIHHQPWEQTPERWIDKQGNYYRGLRVQEAS